MKNKLNVDLKHTFLLFHGIVWSWYHYPLHLSRKFFLEIWLSKWWWRICSGVYDRIKAVGLKPVRKTNPVLNVWYVSTIGTGWPIKVMALTAFSMLFKDSLEGRMDTAGKSVLTGATNSFPSHKVQWGWDLVVRYEIIPILVIKRGFLLLTREKRRQPRNGVCMEWYLLRYSVMTTSYLVLGAGREVDRVGFLSKSATSVSGPVYSGVEADRWSPICTNVNAAEMESLRWVQNSLLGINPSLSIDGIHALFDRKIALID